MRINLPLLYFKGRITGLEFTIIFTVAWVIFGFDSTLEGSLDPSKSIGLGFHWSTLQTLFLFFYLGMLNFNVGGLKSLHQLKWEVKRDLRYVFRLRPERKMLNSIDQWRYMWPQSRYYEFGPLRGLICSFSIAMIGLGAFDIPWAFLYNYFQFGDLMWPIYRLDGGVLIFRNFGVTLGVLYLYIYALKAPPNLIKKILEFQSFSEFNIPSRFKVKLRLDGYALGLLILTALVWGFWIYNPNRMGILFVAELDGNLVLSSEVGGPWIFPSQTLFPQTTYTYYNVSRGEIYSGKNMGGWWQDDPPVHALNLLAKYLTFATVGYIMMVKVKPKT